MGQVDLTNEVLLGDCLDLMGQLEDDSIDMVLCDLPYGITQCKWDAIVPLDQLWDHYHRVVKPNGAILLFGSEPFSSTLRTSNPKDFRYDWYWIKNKKTGFLNAKKQPLRQVETISVFYKRQPEYNPQKSRGHKPVNSYVKHTGDGDTLGKTQRGFSGGGQTDRYPTNVLEFPVVQNDGSKQDEPRLHPSQKPVDLLGYLILTYTSLGDTVLDNCAGWPAPGQVGISSLWNRTPITIGYVGNEWPKQNPP